MVTHALQLIHQSWVSFVNSMLKNFERLSFATLNNVAGLLVLLLFATLSDS